MHAHDVFALAAALASGVLALLHALVWRSQRTRWSALFAIAFVFIATIYAFDGRLRPTGAGAPPVAAWLAIAAAVALTAAMVDYVGLAGPVARGLTAAAVAVGGVMGVLIVMRQVPRLAGFAVLSGYLFAQAALALHAMRREPRRGHGIVVLALLSYPAVIAAAVLGLYDVALLRYAAAVPTSVLGMTVLTTGLLRAQQAAREDLAARVRAEDDLRQLNEQLEQRVLQRTEALHGMVTALESFNRSISHDLRGPLGGIAGVSRLATEAMDAGDTAQARRLMPAITRQAESSAELVDALLALARVDDSLLAPRPVPLGEVVADSLAELRLAAPQAPPPPVDVAPLPTWPVDPLLMRQVFVNLIGNALKFSRGAASPRVALGVHAQADDHLVLFVRDHGVGFDPARAGDLFQPFRQLHGGTHAGHGVGLSIVRRIVERHGGQVWATSSPGAGATFFVRLACRGAGD